MEAVENQLDANAYRGARRKLENDVRKRIERTIADNYAGSANVHSKDELLELIDDLVARAETLAEKTPKSK